MRRRLENRFSMVARKQKRLSAQELKNEITMSSKAEEEKFKKDAFSVFLKNNGTNKREYQLREIISGGRN